ncbi:hypothetical protein K1T71_012349 [Dendrolimus kikuchii]|uniref:Uncharacterized protein n=1 Tax=Dendrolimus kikuchii TaxID=765133 RepID=A0ACC1CLE6_9NEOP|nr:hypothetical protein K1T71_012349 [Dendrolimus kikuchii]
MSHHWLLITFSWFGSASLQYINTGGPGADTILDPLDPTTMQYPFPYINYFNVPRTEYDLPSEAEYQNDEKQETQEVLRRRRTTDDGKAHSWLPNLVDTDRTMYLKNEDQASPFVIGVSAVEDNGTEILESPEKKAFSPWGGKRDKAMIDHMWTWKRGNGIREPSMPKRVRFSPWGGKRSGQMIYKPSTKGSRIIFSTSLPELTKIVSNYSPNGERFNLAGFHFIPSLDKRNPMKILALTTKMDEKSLREALPFKSFLDNIPKMFKPGHPYLDVDLKKDGKRKVKFSAWGGKRSPPIIGPIWTPAPQNIKEATLNTILLIRNNQDKEDQAKLL